MRIDSIDVEKAIQNAKALIAAEPDLSAGLKSALEVLLILVAVLVNRVTLTSSNSSKPPASDPNRTKSCRKSSSRPSGGQPEHVGTTLTKSADPDIVTVIQLDQSTLPSGQYREVGVETRQVVDLDISRVVTEYRAQILEEAAGKRFVAPFPAGVSKAVQYGNQLKAHAVYLSQHQLLPYQRIQQYFADQLQIPISQGSLYNFNQQVFAQLADFEQISKQRLAQAGCVHADETGININGKRHWLHTVTNDSWTHFAAHHKRGTEAMDAIAILPHFQGILCHDHWKPYYRYECTHALCNAHHLRELTRAWEQDQQVWANDMKQLMETINRAVHDAGGVLDKQEANQFRQRYRAVLDNANRECPPPDPPLGKPIRGRIKRSKARNLLERLFDYEGDVLRFMDHPLVPFTNNRAENAIRMTKVQQKISGCFRSQEGADAFCRIRGYLTTCRQQGMTASQAMALVFEEKLPDFAK